MTKLAINLCRDPEILDFVKDNGCVSFVFPSKETHLYRGVKSPKEEIWTWKDILMQSFFSSFYVRHEPLDLEDYVTNVSPERRNVLPFARWEELVEEKISSLPTLLKRKVLDVFRSFCIEIDKWIKYHSQVWENFSKFHAVPVRFSVEFIWTNRSSGNC
ncbi:uncharacterized protein TNCV_4311601 [Trichonephila clavipes]|nr:uncharacterized protein TNCV_4311601 [Trichonephila clavipes]